MPRKNPLSVSELAICNRLREYRLILGLSQVQFASRAGLKRSNLVSYEEGAARLNYPAALRIIRAFPISPEWLATGAGLRMDSPWESLPDSIAYGPRTPFSLVWAQIGDRAKFDTIRKQFTDLKSQKIESPKPEFSGPCDALARLEAERKFHQLLRIWVDLVADCQFNELLNKMAAAGEKAFKLHPPELVAKRVNEMDKARACQRILDSLSKSPLTDAPLSEHISSVLTEMETLLAKVRVLAEPRGAQSRLSEFLNVPTSRVSEWLSGKCDPDGRNTLRLLKWVAAEEAKQKSPASALTPAEPKTRSRKSIHEKPKSSPP